MTKFDDNTLMLYVDGELSREDRAAIDEQIMRDADFKHRVDQLKRVDDLLGQAFGGPMQAEPPKALVDFILRAPRENETKGDGTGEAIETTARVVPLRPRRMLLSQYALPLAASLAFLGGIGIGAFVTSSPQPLFAPGAVAQSSKLLRLLDTVPTGVRTADLQILGTFRDRGQRLCREVEQFSSDSASTPTVAAIACRETNGRWRIEGAARIAIADTGSPSGFKPSGTASADAMAGLVTTIGGGPLLSADEERVLIERQWRPK